MAYHHCTVVFAWFFSCDAQPCRPHATGTPRTLHRDDLDAEMPAGDGMGGIRRDVDGAAVPDRDEHRAAVGAVMRARDACDTGVFEATHNPKVVGSRSRLLLPHCF